MDEKIISIPVDGIPIVLIALKHLSMEIDTNKDAFLDNTQEQIQNMIASLLR